LAVGPRRKGRGRPAVGGIFAALQQLAGRREKREEREPPGADREAGTGEESNKIHTIFRFFRASPDESTVGVVFSFPAGIMGDGAKLDKTRPKLDAFKNVLVGKAAGKGLNSLTPDITCRPLSRR